MSNICFDIYIQMSENRRLSIKEGVSLEELALLMSKFFFKEENWHKMKECWLENGKSKDFQHLMKEALLGAYDTFCIEMQENHYEKSYY